MRTQLWVDHSAKRTPSPDLIVPVEGREVGAWSKPQYRTGLWTSTFAAEGSWVEWCRTEGYSNGDRPLEESGFWLLDVAPRTRIYTIDTYADLARLHERYPAFAEYGRGPNHWRDAKVDWRAASRHFDGIHLTDAGQWRTRLSDPLNLYGWDCESTLWFRWRFENVRPITWQGALRPLWSRYTPGERELARYRRQG